MISADINEFANQWHSETEAASTARKRAAELGITTISPAGAGLLSAVIASNQSKAVVEVGTGTGLTGLAVFAGLQPDGVLTTIDADGHHQAAAKDAFGVAGNGANARLITGIAAEVLPRLADGAYDAVVINDTNNDIESYVEQAKRLLRPGGAVIITNANSAQFALKPLAEDEALLSTAVPVDDGIILAIKRP